MLRTIVIGNHVSVQGNYVRDLPDGKILIQVGDRVYAGWPVQRMAA